MSPKLVGRHRRERPAHAFRFQLEHADRVAPLEQLVDLLIVPGRALEKSTFDALLAEQPLGLLEDGQGLEAEEVELHQARGLDIFHVELGDRHVGARVAIERNELVEPPVADHHAGGVGRGVARQALQLHREIDEAADVGVALVLGRQLRDAVQRRVRGSTGRSDGSASSSRAGRRGRSSSGARGPYP